MSTAALNQEGGYSSTKLAASGALAGLVGGLVFGMMMWMMGMLPMVGMLVRQENSAVGFVVHMAISAFLGALYGIIAGRFALKSTAALAGGIVYGIVWWVLGALILMPLMLGMTQMVFAIGQPQLFSLVGHIIFGVVTALVFIQLAKRN